MFHRRGYALVHLLLLLAGGLNAQTIVSTAPENRRAVLEEYGGMYCVYCPHGHDIITELDQTLGSDLILLNYQTGPYATPIGDDPDLGSDYSEALQDLCQLTGYPAATVNRHVFPGLEQSIPGTTAMGRGDWPEAVTTILQETAPVNIAATATLDISTRQLELYIEYYYTEDVPLESNRLHVAVLQNNVLAPQHGGDEGNYYNHQHLFREFLTGQWGHIISNTDAESFGSLTYNLTLPEYYRDVWVDPVNIELAVFITEAEQEVLNGIEVKPELSSSYASDANLLAIQAPDDICSSSIAGTVRFRNDGNTPLESCTISFGIVGGFSDAFTWTGSLEPLEEATIPLPELPIVGGQSSNNLVVQLLDPNDTPDPSAYNNQREHNFTLAPTADAHYFELVLRTDNFGYELYWEVVDDNGTIHASGGNEIVGQTNGGAQIATPSDAGAYMDNSFIVEEFTLPAEGCYQLRVLDDFADGICCNYGNGFYRLRQPGQDPLLQGGEFGALDQSFFIINTTVTSTAEVLAAEEKVTVYPNPARSGTPLQIRWPAAIPTTYEWQLLNASGALVEVGNEAQLPATNGLPAGYYLMRLQYADQLDIIPVIIAQ